MDLHPRPRPPSSPSQTPPNPPLRPPQPDVPNPVKITRVRPRSDGESVRGVGFVEEGVEVDGYEGDGCFLWELDGYCVGLGAFGSEGGGGNGIRTGVLEKRRKERD